MFKKYFFTLCLIISSFILIYTFYKSEIYWNGSKRDYYLTYYVISIVLIISSIIIFFVSEQIKTYLIVILGSVIFSLYLCEGYLTYAKSTNNLNKKIKLYKKQTGKNYDTRTKFEIYNDLKKDYKNIAVPVGTSARNRNLEISSNSLFPLSAISNSKTIQCNENGYYAIHQSDRYGFNNPDSEWDKKEIEYLLVGDSYAYGACVNRPNDIGSVLRKLSNKSVINLGYGGNGPLVEYATLREYLSPNVKNVLLLYYEGNDLVDLDISLKNKILNNYLHDKNFTQDLKSKQNQIDKLAKLMVEREIEDLGEKKKSKEDAVYYIKLSNLRAVLSNYLPKRYQAGYHPKSVQPQFKEILKNARDLTAQNQANFYFVYLPEYSRYKFNTDENFYKKIKSIVEALNIPFIDVHEEVFKKESNQLKLFPFELSGHYNVEGYSKVAGAIYKFILNDI